jgi:hypothetical protein
MRLLLLSPLLFVLFACGGIARSMAAQSARAEAFRYTCQRIPQPDSLLMARGEANYQAGNSLYRKLHFGGALQRYDAACVAYSLQLCWAKNLEAQQELAAAQRSLELRRERLEALDAALTKARMEAANEQ